MSWGKVKKTEHNGAKNGGGYWGRRVEAKEMSKRKRRQKDKELISEALEEVMGGSEDRVQYEE